MRVVLQDPQAAQARRKKTFRVRGITRSNLPPKKSKPKPAMMVQMILMELKKIYEVGSDAGMAGEHSQEHMNQGVAFTYGPYGDIPTHMHKALVEADIEPSMVKHLTFEDCKTSMGFSLREYCILKEQVEFVLHVKKLAEASRKRTDVPMSSEAGSHKRQNVNGASSSSQGQEEPVKPVDPFEGFNRKVPTGYPAALPDFNSSSKTNPDFWFQGFENTLKSLSYHPTTWAALLTMAVRTDEGVYTWVQTVMATQVVDYMTLKRHLISSFQTPIQVEKEYGRLLQLHMKTMIVRSRQHWTTMLSSACISSELGRRSRIGPTGGTITVKDSS